MRCQERVLIGSGSYGQVYKARYKDRNVVLKELQHTEEQDMFKEARFHSNLSHENVVELVAMCSQPKALMLEYIFFDLGPFGGTGEVSSLDKLISEVDKSCHFDNFEHLVQCVAICTPKGSRTGT